MGKLIVEGLRPDSDPEYQRGWRLTISFMPDQLTDSDPRLHTFPIAERRARAAKHGFKVPKRVPDADVNAFILARFRERFPDALRAEWEWFLKDVFGTEVL